MTFKIVQKIPDISITNVGGISTSGPIAMKTGCFRIVSKDDAYIEFGTFPGISTTSSFWIAGKQVVVVKNSAKSQSFAGIQTGTTTKIYLKEGIGCAFEVGEYISIDGPALGGIGTNMALISSIDYDRNYYGYPTTKITVNWNTASQPPASDTTGEMRSVIKIAAANDGTGANKIHITEVQVSSGG